LHAATRKSFEQISQLDNWQLAQANWVQNFQPNLDKIILFNGVVFHEAFHLAEEVEVDFGVFSGVNTESSDDSNCYVLELVLRTW